MVTIDRSKFERIMFIDEQIFTTNGYFNSKNDLIWTDDRSDDNERGGLHSIEKYPMCLVVPIDATSYRLTRPYFFLKGERLNGQSYHDQLLSFYNRGRSTTIRA